MMAATKRSRALAAQRIAAGQVGLGTECAGARMQRLSRRRDSKLAWQNHPLLFVEDCFEHIVLLKCTIRCA